MPASWRRRWSCRQGRLPERGDVRRLGLPLHPGRAFFRLFGSEACWRYSYSLSRMVGGSGAGGGRTRVRIVREEGGAECGFGEGQGERAGWGGVRRVPEEAGLFGGPKGSSPAVTFLVPVQTAVRGGGVSARW